jgi:hypothetical protein
LLKHNFNGRHYELPIAIQKSILNRLREYKIRYVKVLIMGIEKISFWTLTEVEDIYKEGVLMKEDRSNTNITKWGYQYVWDVAGKGLDLSRVQQTINESVNGLKI